MKLFKGVRSVLRKLKGKKPDNTGTKTNRQTETKKQATNSQRPKMVTPLTAEDIERLKQHKDLSMNITQDELLASYCTHKFNGAIRIKQDLDESLSCDICGEVFKLHSLEEEDVKETIVKVIDLLNTIKLQYMDISPEVAKNVFPIIPILHKVPKLAKLAKNNFASYEAASMFSAMQPFYNKLPEYGQPFSTYPYSHIVTGNDEYCNHLGLDGCCSALKTNNDGTSECEICHSKLNAKQTKAVLEMVEQNKRNMK